MMEGVVVELLAVVSASVASSAAAAIAGEEAMLVDERECCSACLDCLPNGGSNVPPKIQIQSLTLDLPRTWYSPGR